MRYCVVCLKFTIYDIPEDMSSVTTIRNVLFNDTESQSQLHSISDEEGVGETTVGKSKYEKNQS